MPHEYFPVVSCRSGCEEKKLKESSDLNECLMNVFPLFPAGVVVRRRS